MLSSAAKVEAELSSHLPHPPVALESRELIEAAVELLLSLKTLACAVVVVCICLSSWIAASLFSISSAVIVLLSSCAKQSAGSNSVIETPELLH